MLQQDKKYFGIFKLCSTLDSDIRNWYTAWLWLLFHFDCAVGYVIVNGFTNIPIGEQWSHLLCKTGWQLRQEICILNAVFSGFHFEAIQLPAKFTETSKAICFDRSHCVLWYGFNATHFRSHIMTISFECNILFLVSAALSICARIFFHRSYRCFIHSFVLCE